MVLLRRVFLHESDPRVGSSADCSLFILSPQNVLQIQVVKILFQILLVVKIC